MQCTPFNEISAVNIPVTTETAYYSERSLQQGSEKTDEISNELFLGGMF